MNLEEIKSLAVYAEQSRRMTWRIEEDCTEKLNTYVRETCNIIFGVTVLHIYNHYLGEKYFLPEGVSFTVDEDDEVSLYLAGRTLSKKFGEERIAILLEDVMRGERGRSTYQQWEEEYEED